MSLTIYSNIPVLHWRKQYQSEHWHFQLRFLCCILKTIVYYLLLITFSAYHWQSVLNISNIRTQTTVKDIAHDKIKTSLVGLTLGFMGLPAKEKTISSLTCGTCSVTCVSFGCWGVLAVWDARNICPLKNNAFIAVEVTVPFHQWYFICSWNKVGDFSQCDFRWVARSIEV